MKRIAMIAAILLSATLCPAQSDSAKPAADSVKVKVQQTTDDSATVTVTAEKGGTDSTTTVIIRSGRERDQRRQRRRDWVLGCRMANLEFKNFPGTVTLQRRLGRLVTAGLGFAYASDSYGPSDNSTQHDSSTSTESVKYRSLTLSPEVMLVGRRGPWQAGIGLRYSYSKSRSGSNYESADSYPSGNASYRRNTTSIYTRISLEVPLTVEHLFAVGGLSFSIGLTGVVVSAMSDETTSETTTVSSNTWSGAQTNVSTSTSKTPMSFLLQAPFQGTTGIQLKYYF